MNRRHARLPLYGMLLALALHAGLAAQEPAAQSSKPPTILSDLESGMRLMYVSAHPDDEVAVGPLLARAADLTDVIVVSLTDGGGGENRAGVPLDGTLGQTRAKEFAASCAKLGVDHRLLGFENEPPEEVRRQMMRERRRETAEEAIARWRASGRDPQEELVKAIRAWKPDIILSFDAEQGFTLHREHQAVGLLVPLAIRDAADPARWPEQLTEEVKPWQVQRWYTALNRFASARNPRIPEVDPAKIDEIVDGRVLSPKRGKTYLDIAFEAMAQHATQFGGDFLTPDRKAMFEHELEAQALVLEFPK